MKISITLSCILLLISCTLTAQMRISPVSRASFKNNATLRTESPTLTLPFWDDFSTSSQIPSANFWVDSDNVWVNDGMGIRPPSLNVATFDSFDVDGKPYSLDNLTDGLTDVLTSCAIDISGNNPADNVYLSFFYQAKGNGEIPNDNDSLRLEFKDLNGDWKRAWSITGKTALIDTFEIVTIQLTDPDFFHNDFQFQFESYGRQSGGFDSWSIDYVYMNDNVTNFDFPDRAVQLQPSSMFKLYSSIPIHHFNQDPSILLETPVSTAYNLFDLLQPSNFSMIAEIESLQPDLSYILTEDTLAFEVISSFPDPQIAGVRQIDLVASQTLDPSKVVTDSLANITLKLFMNTDDNQPPDYQPEFSPLDFTVNDTTRIVQVLHDYYAYDDGSAEFAAGLNLAGDVVAYQFPMFFNGMDTLVSVDMYFPNLEGNVGGKVIELKIWRDLDDLPGSLLHSQFVSLEVPAGINEFTTYLLQKPVVVEDTFYIGWEQNNNGNLDIGLDKNTDSGDRIWFNLDGTWNQNVAVKGSLMLRPRFGEVNVILDNEEIVDPGFELFPNPNNGNFTITGNISNLQIFDTSGRLIEYGLIKRGDRKEVSVTQSPPGIYLVRFMAGDSHQSRKIIIRN